VLGHVLLRRVGSRLQLLHGRRRLAQRVEQANPHRLGEHAKALGDQLDQRSRQRVRDLGSNGHLDHENTTLSLFATAVV
jgi:hypothetical protein